MDQFEKAQRFKAMHEGPLFVIPTRGTRGRRGCSRAWGSGR